VELRFIRGALSRFLKEQLLPLQLPIYRLKVLFNIHYKHKRSLGASEWQQGHYHVGGAHPHITTKTRGAQPSPPLYQPHVGDAIVVVSCCWTRGATRVVVGREGSREERGRRSLRKERRSEGEGEGIRGFWPRAHPFLSGQGCWVKIDVDQQALW